MGQIRTLVMLSALAGTSSLMAACAPQTSAPVVSGYGQKNRVVMSSVKSRTDVANPLRRDEALIEASPKVNAVEAPETVIPKPIVKPFAVRAQPVAPTPVMVKHDVLATDTAYKLARKYNTSVDRILKDNGLKSTTEVREGLTLSIAQNSKPQTSAWDDMKRMLSEPVVRKDPATNQIVAVENPIAAPAAPLEKVEEVAVLTAPPKLLADIEPAAGERPGKGAEGVNYVTYTVQPKETIYRISLKYNVSVLDIMAANEFAEPQDLKADAVIRVPVKSSITQQLMAKHDAVNLAPSAGAVEPAANEMPVAVQDAEKPVQVAMLSSGGNVGPREDLETKAVKQQAVRDAGLTISKDKPLDKDSEQKAEMKRGQIDPDAARAKGLIWPVKGQIVRKFGDDGSGVARTGINIAVPKGTAVLASEGGKVLYADDGLKIYGKLVLVRHDNGMVSAYAHNSYLLVKKNESVKKGQVIALSGASGNVESPQLHFELRQHASAIDPLAMLPRL